MTTRIRWGQAPLRWGQAPPGWGQPQLPGWAPLVDHGPLPLQTARSVGRWWWPTLTLAGFGIVTGFIVGHDHPTPGLSPGGLLTITLAAVVVILLTIHRRNGPGPLARALAEYTVVALLAALLAAAGAGTDPPPADPPTATQAQANPEATAGDHRPGLLRVGAAVLRAVTTAAKAVTGAARWLADLWRQADQQTTPKGEAMATPPHAPTPPPLWTWRSGP